MAIDFLDIVKKYNTLTSDYLADASVDRENYEQEEREQLDEMKAQLKSGEITQSVFDEKKKAIVEKQKEVVKLWRDKIQNADNDIFNAIVDDFESIINIDEEDIYTLPLCKGKMLKIPADYTPKEINCITKLMKDFQNANDNEKANASIVEAREKCIALNLSFTLDGVKLKEYEALDIENTRTKDIPDIITYLPSIVHAMDFVCRYNQIQLLKKK